ncbi:MAG TPA: hypothetical protein VGC79_29045 [Polyangiaceae bacterium]
MLLYRALHLLKFIGIMLLAGGALGSFLAREPAVRARAVHGIASPGLLLTWLAGYLLSLILGISASELWIVGGLMLSFAAHVALVLSASRTPSPAGIAAVFAPLLCTLTLMVFRPTWAMLFG